MNSKYMVAVLAGNYKQFLNYLLSQHKQYYMDDMIISNEYVYIDRLEKCIGRRFDDFRIIGTFFERKDADMLLGEVRSRYKKT